MKNPGIYVLAMTGLLIATHVSAYSDVTNQFIATVEGKTSTMSVSQQQDYLKNLKITLDTDFANPINEESQLLYTELQDRISQKSGMLLQEPSAVDVKEVSYQDMPNIDFDKVRQAWLGWHNELRAQQGLEPYTYHSDLEKTAKNWADYLVGLKKATHKRTVGDGYYNYWGIKKWFANLGVFFAKESGGRNAFSESIGYRSYRCSTGDCTQELISATKKVFDAFVAEGKGGVHYRALVMPHFRQIGVGFQFEPEKKYVYTVIHYAEKVLDN